MGPTLSSEATKLSSEVGQKKIKKETVFILDWDDTLMCTYFLTQKNQNLSESEKNLILNLGKIVSIFLSHCQEYGRIIILTNSGEKWVNKTAKEYLGLGDLNEKNIKIFSTRDKYCKKGLDIKKWKELALNDIIDKFGNKIENLICASDSEKDINTFKKFMKKNTCINVSTIKFKRKPSLLIMQKEIKYLIDNIDSIIGTNKNYYLMKESKEKDIEDFNFHFGNLFDYIFPN